MGELDVHVTCRDFVAGLAEYLDGSQPRASRRAFAAHRRRCSQCQRYSDEYSLTIVLSRLACGPADPADLPESLVWNVVSRANEANPTLH